MVRFNIIFTGSFSYPKGMAGTKRIQNLIDVLAIHDIVTKVLLIYDESNNKRGSYYSTDYYTIFPTNKIKKLLFLPYYLLVGFWYLKRYKINDTDNFLYVYSGINFENIALVKFAKFINYKIIVDYVEDFTLNEDSVSKWRKQKIRSINYFEKKIKNYVDGIIVISTYLLEKFQKLTLNEIPIHLMPVTSWENFKLENEHVDFNKILYSGSYGSKDGVESLIKAFLLLSSEFPSLKLVLTGKPKRSIIQLIEANADVVEITGYLSDKEYYKKLRTSFILTMTRDDSGYANAGFPFKLGEYLATGNPVIATGVSDVCKYLENGKDAIIIPPNNTKELYLSMKYLIQNIPTAIKIGIQGGRVHEKYFSPIENGKKLIQFINKIAYDI